MLMHGLNTRENFHAALRTGICSSAILLGLSGSPALAEYIEVYPISTDPADWQPDRKETSTFTRLDSYQGRNDVLALETFAEDAAASSFNQWEGYTQKTTVPAGNSMIGGDVWITGDWQQGTDSDYIRTSMWGSAMTEAEVATGNYNDNDAVFPIVQFTNQGGTGRLEIWNPQEGWIDLPETAGLIGYNGWNSIDMRLVTGENGEATAIEYYFNDELVYTWDDPKSSNGTSPEQYFAMYLKNRNHGGTDFTSYWSRLLSGQVFYDDVEIDNFDGDILIVPGAQVTFAPNATINGTVAIKGKSGEPVSLTFDGPVQITEDFVVSNGSVSFFDAEGGSTTIEQDLYVENNAQTKGGTVSNPIVVNGDGFVDETSTLGGNLAIGKNLTIGGRILPGNSIGTVTVGGNFNLGFSSTYEVEVNTAGQADLIEVGGIANLAGSVVVDTMDGYLLNHDYIILTAAGGFNGTEFPDSTPVWNNVNDYAFVRPVISYDPTTVFLTVQRNNASFASVAETPNQVAVANALETMGGSSSLLYNDIVLQLTVQEAPMVYDALSGEVYASVKSSMIEQSQYILDAVTGRLQQAFGGKSVTPIKAMGYAPSDDDAQMNGYYAEPESTYGAWGYAYGGWSEQKGDSNTGKLKSDTGGFVAGFDGALSENWRVGALAGYGYTSFDNDKNATGNANAYTLGAYAGGQWDVSDSTGWALRSGLAYTWNTPEVDRTVSFGNFYDQLNGSYDANTFQAFGEIAFQYQPADQLQLEPYANLSYVNLNTSSFNENGSTAAALGVQSDTMNTYFSTLGMRTSTGFDIGSTKADAYFDAGWRHAYGDLDPTSTAALTGSSPFTVTGVPVARDTAIIGVGMDFNVTEMTSIGLGYEGQFGDGYTQNSVTARLDIRF